MKTVAAVAVEPGQPFEVLELDLEGPRSGEVLVRMGACGLCHTDVHSASGGEPWRKFPFVPGHEGCGVVEEIGSDVETLAVGDKVIPLYKSECGTCPNCRSGRTNNCATVMPTQKAGVLLDGTSRFSLRGREVLHYMGCSALSRYTVLPEISLARIAPAADPEAICLMGCGVTTGLGAVLKVARVCAGSSVAVFGLGGIGLAAVQGARLAGASHIVAVDVREEKLALARQFGATAVLLAREGTAAEIVGQTGGGCDYTFEAAGTLPAMQAALEAAHPLWGTCCLLGNTPPEARLSIHPGALLGGRRVLGCTFGGVLGRSELPAYVDRALAGDVDLESMITHRLGIEDINRAVEIMHAGQSIRSVITFP